MVDNRSAGFFGVGGAFNFKSGDISGTAARTQDDKMGLKMVSLKINIWIKVLFYVQL